MKVYHVVILILLGTIFLFWISCEIDHGLSPKEYKIKGTVTFFKGEPPENTDRVEVFALKEFPPQDPQNFLYLGRSGPLDYQSSRQLDYEILVSPTSYQFIGVLWKEKGRDWNLTGLMGFYMGKSDGFSFFPDSVVVSEDHPVVDGVDFTANWELVSKDARISGKITYQGSWPPETELLLLAVYPSKPNTWLEYLTFSNFDYSQPIFVDSSSYELSINSGIYNYIVLFWIGKNISDLNDMIAIGYYEDPADPGKPGRIEINKHEELTGIDIHVDFNKIVFP